MSGSRRAQVVGTGLIGGSVGLALRRRGWHVTGSEADPEVGRRALDLGVVEEIGVDPDAELVVLATPVGRIADAAAEALARHPRAAVTDVGSVKGPVVEAVDDPRFVGGHPMAGSEQEGVDGADAAMFEGAVWVLTPTPSTDATAHALVHGVVASLGAEVVTLDPWAHDRVVAMVSHVPHLAAATLMGLAAGRAAEQGVLLRLAAGGFRDMTRIAAGHPGIWPDICSENRDAIVGVLDELIGELATVRAEVSSSDRSALLGRLEVARKARLNLPVAAARAEGLAELRITVPDRPGQLSTVTTIATDLGVNIHDIGIAHSAEGAKGVLILLVDAASSATLGPPLERLGYHVAVRAL